MNIIVDCEKYILNTYRRYPLIFTHGEGMWLYTENNEKFLDMSSGIAVSSLGHNHPELTKAITDQSKKLIHTSNLYYTEPAIKLAKKLISKSCFDKVFFCNSGAEANEAAIKLSRKHGNKSGNNQKYKIITLKKSFHGRTMATLSATGQEKIQKGFKPLLEGFEYVELNNINDLEQKIDKNTASLILEPIQGEGGINIPNIEFVKKAKELCDKNNALFIFDEIQTGIGRTGKLFGYEYFLPIEPDVITLAKGLGGGMPIGAMLVKDKYADLLGPGEHASTFGGNPVCCAAANAVLNTIEKEGLLDHVESMGIYFREKLESLKNEFSIIKEIRGMGLLNGIEVDIHGQEIINKLIDKKIITVPAGTNVVRFLPPFIVKKEHIDLTIDTLNKILNHL